MATLATHPDYSLYANAFGFLRQPLDFNPQASDADVIITGVPFDMATTGRSGSRMGPGAIRQISTNLAWEGKRWPWSFSLTDKISMADCGDLVFDCGDAGQMCERLEQHATSLIEQGKTLLTFGGDHFVTLPLLRAHAKKHGEMALIHFDAHTDTYDMGSQYDHGTMFYHAPNEGLIDPKHSVQIGIRTDYDNTLGFNVIDAGTANDWSVEQIVENIKQTVGDRPVYLTFDIDCLDPAFAPGTGTPVCGGLTSDKALKIIRGLQGINLIGMDVVEVAPAYDHADMTALAAATIATDLLHLWASQR
ncbi:agmatinase [Photobacterium sanguinicancri]|uniref:Agmatinase n=1 Tax=Photobacterium sanguinicancri TaxID=875932 RepID=A0AAW7Y153_9GAMM|nr:agmatinase [Photobacterium sanguinicancri]KXI23705.1 agmatinase [Photobacterium sanguinicancri]MDO6541048.1 agmatinase [Photobacterium sanguinicancri]